MYSARDFGWFVWGGELQYTHIYARTCTYNGTICVVKHIEKHSTVYRIICHRQKNASVKSPGCVKKKKKIEKRKSALKRGNRRTRCWFIFITCCSFFFFFLPVFIVSTLLLLLSECAFLCRYIVCTYITCLLQTAIIS